MRPRLQNKSDSAQYCIFFYSRCELVSWLSPRNVRNPDSSIFVDYRPCISLFDTGNSCCSHLNEKKHLHNKKKKNKIIELRKLSKWNNKSLVTTISQSPIWCDDPSKRCVYTIFFVDYSLIIRSITTESHALHKIHEQQSLNAYSQAVLWVQKMVSSKWHLKYIFIR